MGAHDVQGSWNTGVIRDSHKLIAHDITHRHAAYVDFLREHFDHDIAVGQNANRGVTAGNFLHHQDIAHVLVAHQLDCTAK